METNRNKYVWLGTTKAFDSFTFAFVHTGAGWIWFHAYSFDAGTSTCIVECSPETWEGLGFDRLSLDGSLALLERIFKHHLDGHPLIVQARDAATPWLNFRRVTNRRWSDGNVVLVGDAAHSTHFTIGSGTTLAIEDAMVLSATLAEHEDVPTALAAYERERRAALARMQRDARNSARWFENVPRYIDQNSERFAMLLRKRRSTLLAHLPPAGYCQLYETAREFQVLRSLKGWIGAKRRSRSAYS
jgi:2-polyprenyl-6-methoxyphenol hydroxylase-like FAD-dependent oxidoreductase